MKSYKAKILEEPRVVFELPVLVQVSEQRYQCQLCGESPPTRIRAMRLGHILPDEIARDDVEKPL